MTIDRSTADEIMKKVRIKLTPNPDEIFLLHPALPGWELFRRVAKDVPLAVSQGPCLPFPQEEHHPQDQGEDLPPAMKVTRLEDATVMAPEMASPRQRTYLEKHLKDKRYYTGTRWQGCFYSRGLWKTFPITYREAEDLIRRDQARKAQIRKWHLDRKERGNGINNH